MATSSSILNLFTLLGQSKPPATPPQRGVPVHLSMWGEKKRGDGLWLLGASASPGFNVEVEVEENEPDEYALNRFRREVMSSGIIQECKRRRYFENKQEERKRRIRDAHKRNRARRPYRPPTEESMETSNSVEEDDDDDNWELP